MNLTAGGRFASTCGLLVWLVMFVGLALLFGGCTFVVLDLVHMACDDWECSQKLQDLRPRPKCPAGVDPRVVTWCRVVPAEPDR